jgi:hypothetical protein
MCKAEKNGKQIFKIPKTKRRKYGMNETFVMSKLRWRFHQILVAFSGNLNFEKATFDSKFENKYFLGRMS